MGAGASAQSELPETLDLATAQAAAQRLGMSLDDWPEELWASVAVGGVITRAEFTKICTDLGTVPGDDGRVSKRLPSFFFFALRKMHQG